MREPRIVRSRQADDEHRVLSVEGGTGGAMRSPCPECPWRRENAGTFPAEAFRLSAETAYDMATRSFGCHQAGPERSITCAGAVLGTHHSLTLRMRADKLQHVHDGGADLFPDYRSMAIANGVDPDDPVLGPCR